MGQFSIPRQILFMVSRFCVLLVILLVFSRCTTEDGASGGTTQPNLYLMEGGEFYTNVSVQAHGTNTTLGINPNRITAHLSDSWMLLVGVPCLPESPDCMQGITGLGWSQSHEALSSLPQTALNAVSGLQKLSTSFWFTLKLGPPADGRAYANVVISTDGDSPTRFATNSTGGKLMIVIGAATPEAGFVPLAENSITTATKSLVLTSMCSNYPNDQRFWRIYNPNHNNVTTSWEVYDTEQSGSVSAPPGYTFFYTKSVADSPNTTKLYWVNVNAEPKMDVKASLSDPCQF